MYKQTVPTIGEVADKAIFPFDIDLDIDNHVGRMQQTIVEYYRRNPHFGLTSYDFLVDDVIVNSTDSLLGRPFTINPSISNINLTSYHFSDYSTSLLEQLGIDLENSWNGEISFVVYNDGDAIVGKSDYYSFKTISRLLQYEALYASYLSDGPTNSKTNDFPIRNSLLRNPADFIYPNRPLSASSGGVIIANTQSGWKLLLGRRSQDVTVNPGMISIFPNGGVEYADLWGGGFAASARREFCEELFDGSENVLEEFSKQYLITKETTCGWNLRDGGMVFGYSFIIPSVEGYEKFREERISNYEIDGLLEIDIFDVDEVCRYLSPQETSGAEIGVICDALAAFDRNPTYPDLPYTIQSRLK